MLEMRTLTVLKVRTLAVFELELAITPVGFLFGNHVPEDIGAVLVGQRLSNVSRFGTAHLVEPCNGSLIDGTTGMMDALAGLLANYGRQTKSPVGVAFLRTQLGSILEATQTNL